VQRYKENLILQNNLLKILKILGFVKIVLYLSTLK
jgi:hypothetical protein